MLSHPAVYGLTGDSWDWKTLISKSSGHTASAPGRLSLEGRGALQVNKLEITTDKSLLAAAGNPHIRLYEVASGTSQPVADYDSHTNNVTAVSPLLVPSYLACQS